MADTKITALTALTAADPANDVIPIVDVSDTSMAASGTTKKISVNNILGASGTATLASATITGDLTVRTTGLTVNSSGVGVGTSSQSSFLGNSPKKLVIGDGTQTPALTLYGGAANTSGIYFADGTVGNQAYRGFFEYDHNTDALSLGSSGSTKATLDSSGNVGIGVTPSAWNSAFKAVEFGSGNALFSGSSGYSQAYFGNNVFYNTSGNYVYKNTQAAGMYIQNQGAHQWYNAPSGTAAANITFTQAMTLDASGNLLVGQATVAGANIDSFVYNKSGSYAVLSHVSGTGSGTGYIQFLYNNTSIGTITQNGTTGVLYNIVSDYRLKESVVPLSGGLARVNALKPSVYNWKSDGSTGEGFLAHELAEVVPFAVSGEKDAVNADGTIKSQGIDMSRIVPILVAAIQELTAEVNALKNA